MTRLEGLRLDYRAAFLRYLPRQAEAALTSGYEIGRAAVTSGTSLLDLVQVHHEVLAEVLRDSRPDEVAAVTAAASGFLVEVLATYDMTQRALLDDG